MKVTVSSVHIKNGDCTYSNNFQRTVPLLSSVLLNVQLLYLSCYEQRYSPIITFVKGHIGTVPLLSARIANFPSVYTDHACTEIMPGIEHIQLRKVIRDGATVANDSI